MTYIPKGGKHAIKVGATRAMTLTDEQIEAMEAGPEMDRLVAIACGCDPYNQQSFGLKPGVLDDNWNCTCAGAKHGQLRMFGEADTRIRSYSSDLNFAMEAAVVSLGDRIGSEHGLERLSVEFAGDEWHAGLRSNSPYTGWAWRLVFHATTGPLAICRAIIKAKRESIPDEPSLHRTPVSSRRGVW